MWRAWYWFRNACYVTTRRSAVLLALASVGCADSDPSQVDPAAGAAGVSGSGAGAWAGTAAVAGHAGAGAAGGAGAGSAGDLSGAGSAASGTDFGRAGGSGGTATAGAGGAVDLPQGLSGLFPLPGASSVCADPALRLSFASAPTLGNSGKLRVYDAAAPANPVVTIDFAVSSVTKTIGGQTFNLERQVYLDGNDVVVPLDSRALAYGKQYHVTLEEGAIRSAAGAFSIVDTKSWTFQTWASAASGSALSVALDGSGQFCSWQGAIDAVPEKNTSPVTISIKNGQYHGLVYFSGKQAITVRGHDRKKTVLSGLNNNNLNPSSRGRALFGADGASGLVIENVTIANLTPQGGSQAEALRLQGCDKCVIRQADIVSLQDTLLWSGRLYAEDCYVAGNVDFIWGDGAAYFNRCEIKTVERSGYNVQARNGSGKSGYVFVDSKISRDAGITGTTLARVDVAVYPHSHVAYVDCTLGGHVTKAGWTVTGGSAPASLRFEEYRSKTEGGALVDVSARVAGVQLTAEQAAQRRNPQIVLDGWQPPL